MACPAWGSPPPSITMRSARYLVAVLAAVVVSACGAVGETLVDLNNSIMRPAHVQGTFHLAQYGGGALPAPQRVEEGTGCPNGGLLVGAEVIGGTLELSPTGDAILNADVAVTCRSSDGDTYYTERTAQRTKGRYQLEADNRLRLRLGRETLLLQYDEDAQTLASADIGARWGRTPPTQAGAGTAEAQRGLEYTPGEPLVDEDGYPLRSRSRAYDCEDDPKLASAPPIAAADTAGIGARVGSEFPGYRLSTEKEIACRFPLLDGMQPHQVEADFASGNAWWVKRHDLNGDGREDIATVLTNVEDPRRDLLAVLYADGTSEGVTSLGGWGFGAGSDADGPYLFVVYYEKGGDRISRGPNGFSW
jgi:hypothetical protein